MQTTTFRLSIALAFTVITASASTIQILGSGSETGLFDSVTYKLVTVGNNSIGSQTGFTPVTGQATISTITGVDYTNYLASLPVGATVTDATLDFAGMFTGQTYSSS